MLTTLSSFCETKDSISDLYVPISALDQVLYIQKYEPYSASEIAKYIMEENISGQALNRVYQNVELFNIGFYRLINNEIEDLIKLEEYSFVQAIHKRDLYENLDGQYRYVIRSTFDIRTYGTADTEGVKYYIYDQQNHIRYKEVVSLTGLLNGIYKTIKQRKYNIDLVENQLNQYFEKTLPKPKTKTPAPKAVKIILGTIVYGFAQWGIIVVANL